MSSFVAVFDACVLHSAPLRDLLIRAGRAGLVRARWTDQIVDEVVSSLHARRSDIPTERLERMRQLINESVPDCLITGYSDLAPIGLPDPRDEHVVAAAIVAGAQAIVTFNLKDFPDELLARRNIEAKHPDEFVLNLIDLSPGTMARILTEQSADLRKPVRTVPEVLDALFNNGLVQSVARLREIMS